MIKEVRKDIIYETFPSRELMIKSILELVSCGKADSIIHKGNPNDIGYKKIKNILTGKPSAKISPDTIKNQYKSIVESSENRQFCIIYKNK